jgi:hypothetical protein
MRGKNSRFWGEISVKIEKFLKFFFGLFSRSFLKKVDFQKSVKSLEK